MQIEMGKQILKEEGMDIRIRMRLRKAVVDHSHGARVRDIVRRRCA